MYELQQVTREHYSCCFVFFRKLYPELNENLDQFRTHLKESAHEMAPLKVWQLQGTVYEKIRVQRKYILQVSLWENYLELVSANLYKAFHIGLHLPTKKSKNC